MTNDDIDYDNTIIYKITCKDTTIKDVYVGHTTNFVQRKRAHKHSCVNAKSTNHTCKLYTIIREHGGWTNWIMEIIYFFKCNNQCEARIKEQEYFILLNANLNSVEPMPNPKCSIKPSSKSDDSIKTFPDIIEKPQISYKFYCKNCHYGTCKKSNYLAHNLSTKHYKNNGFTPLGASFEQKISSLHICDFCNKKYKDRAGLWRHKKKCDNNVQSNNIIHDASNNAYVFDKEFVMMVLKQNIEIIKENGELKNIMVDTQNQIMEVIKNWYK